MLWYLVVSGGLGGFGWFRVALGWPSPELRAGGAQIFFDNFVYLSPNFAKFHSNFSSNVDFASHADPNFVKFRYKCVGWLWISLRITSEEPKFRKTFACVFISRGLAPKFCEISNEMPTPSNIGKHFAKFRAGPKCTGARE